MFQLHLLKDSDIEPLAQGVHRVLENVGIMCQNAEMLRALQSTGAKVDFEAQRVWFPKKIQEEFVTGLRKDMAQTQEVQSRPFGRTGLPGLGTQVAQFYYDDQSGQPRSGNTKDFITLIKFGESLHGPFGVGHCLLLTDVPPLVEPLEAAILLAEFTSKPGPVFAWNVRTVDYLIEMGEILGVKRLFSYGANCFAHPLRLDKDVADKFVRRVKEGDTAGLTAMPVAGVTAPVTLAGFISVSAAEFLAVWMAGRAINPRAPIGGSMWGGSIDMRTGAVSYCAFDAMLYAFATVEFLRRWCGVRVNVGGSDYCDAKTPGLYTALEKAYKSMTVAAFTGVNPGVGSGMLDEGRMLSPVELLIERDIAQGLQQYSRGLEITPETMAWETISEVGLGIEKNYIESEHTLRHFRECLWLPTLLDRSGWRGAEHEKEVLAKAKKQVKELVAAYRKPQVDPDKLARMREVVERARKELLK